jgi:hypothetical protein
MAVKSPNDRIYNCSPKHDTEVIKQQTDKRHDRMLAGQLAAHVELTELEERAKVILGKHGAPTHTYPAYVNLCREAWKKQKRFHDQTLAREVMVIEAKWVSRELKRPVLVELRKQTLGLPDVV